MKILDHYKRNRKTWTRYYFGEFEREAINIKSINEDQKIVVDKLINLIDEDDDVQNVYHDMG